MFWFWFTVCAGFAAGAFVGAMADALAWSHWVRRRDAWLADLRRDLDGGKGVTR